MPPGLSAARLREDLLTPAGPWRHVDVPAVVDSTNAWSVRDPQPWRVVAAGEQSAGRGRRGRNWETPPGTSVAVSLTVPMPADPARWGWLPLLTGLATRDALAEVTGSPEFALKWPNDVLALDHDASRPGGPGWAKLCGILCETTGSSLVVAGVGVNVSVPRDALPVPTATSLALLGHQVAREDVVVALARAFAGWHERWYAGGAGLDDVRRAYRAHCATLHTMVRIHLGVSADAGPGDVSDEEVVTGEALDVDDSGEIVIQTTAGVRRFAAGDVVHLRPSDRGDVQGAGEGTARRGEQS